MTTKKLPCFVYGTLRNGHGNYERLLKGKTAAEHAAITTGAMFSVHGGAFPALINEPKSEPIKGELMYIYPDKYDEVLRVLDRLEGYNPKNENDSMYVRRKVQLWNESVGVMVEAWVYYWNMGLGGLKAIECGCWNEYKDEKKKPKPKPKQLTKAEIEWSDLWKNDIKF